MSDSATESSDEALMLAYAQGDAAAFEALYNRHEKAVWRYVFRSVQVQSTADDLMQDVWFAVARNAAAYEPNKGGAKFRTWLFTLAHNRMIDFGRTKKNHLSLDAEDDEAQNLHEQLVADSGFGPLKQLASRQQARALIEAVEQLPADQREAFLLQAEGDMSVEEIAVATGVSFETAKSRLRYARNKLKTVLAEFAEAAV
jgi:RNA polymerase sigma factor (sigma-70 family)